MKPDPADMEDDPAVAELRRYFAGRLPDRLAELEEACASARDADWAAEPLRHFHRLAHSLVGVGATFGFPAVTEHARTLERLLKARLEGGAPPPEAEVGELLARLRAAQ
ncbi:MAG TPA: Hpt domain-containing protein [Thermoanaerobaculia bacterium]|jgi:HPt (histidine-containing phosphotransfer) domain-containing protein|nr:Hpt domain-containing protein [Thermoanaerobaculia bacterium]